MTTAQPETPFNQLQPNPITIPELGDGTTAEVLEPGQATTDFWVYPDEDGPIGVATIPAERLVGCLSDPHAGRDVPHAYAVLASGVRPCPGQAPSSTPVVSMDGQ